MGSSGCSARYGALTQNLVVATCYATLGTDAVIHAVNEGREGRREGAASAS